MDWKQPKVQLVEQKTHLAACWHYDLGFKRGAGGKIGREYAECNGAELLRIVAEGVQKKDESNKPMTVERGGHNIKDCSWPLTPETRARLLKTSRAGLVAARPRHRG